jgi:ArsR family transcriptional regulator, lead/cadmium/zinc/bismuth-responsive transcriptional repressor
MAFHRLSGDDRVVTTAVTGFGQSGPPLDQVPLLAPDQAAGLAALFKVLASDTRLRILHALHRGGEVRVSDLAAEVGVTQQAVSNQVQRLLDRGILATRRSGTSIYYRIADPCVPALLQLGICLIEDPSCEER